MDLKDFCNIVKYIQAFVYLNFMNVNLQFKSDCIPSKTGYTCISMQKFMGYLLLPD